LTFSGSNGDTYSAPFYDYTNDVIYVGDNGSASGGGVLHEFTNVFRSGTPAEVTTSPWPITVVTNSDYQLSSPVYDSASKNILVSDLNGYFYSVSSTSGTVVGTSSTQLDTSSIGISDGPLVDSTAGTAYVFVNEDVSSSDNAVYQFATNFTSGSGTEEEVGPGNSDLVSPFLAGDFDNVYYQSSTPSTPSGNLYVLGDTGGAAITLYQIPIASGAMGTPVAAATVSAATNASPLVEFCNNGTSACASSGGLTTAGNDYIFFSVFRGATTVLGSATTCTDSGSHGCVMSINANTPSTLTLTGAGLDVASTAAPPTGGLVIDNSVGSGTLAGASQMYFMSLDNSKTVSCSTAGKGMCAVQASQSAP